MMSVHSLDSPEVPTFARAPLALANSGSQFVETDPGSRSLGKRKQPETVGGILERLGACLVRPFKALRDYVRHLLRDKRREADEVVPLPQPRPKYFNPASAVVSKPAECVSLSNEKPAITTSQLMPETAGPTVASSVRTAMPAPPSSDEAYADVDISWPAETSPVVRTPGPPISPLSLPGTGNAAFKVFVGGTVTALEVAATVLGKKKRLGHGLAKHLQSAPKPPVVGSDKEKYKALFKAAASASPPHEGVAGEPRKGKGMFHKARKMIGVSKPSERPQASADAVIRVAVSDGKGLNALYFSAYGRAATAESVRGLVVDKESGAARIRAFARQLALTEASGATYRSMPLKDVIAVFSDVEHFLALGDALAAFVGGMASFADSFARKYAGQHGKDCLRVAPDLHVEGFVSGLFAELTEPQRKLLKTRLVTGLAEPAQRIFTFAHEQASLYRGGELGHQLSRLGFGLRLMDALRAGLNLEPWQGVESVNVDDLNVDELAALSRVLMPPPIHSIRV